MAHNTNNPVGSTDPRDLYDNAGNLDKFVNGDAPFYPDRLGKQRKSWSGIEDDFSRAQEGREAAFQQVQSGREVAFQEFLESSGFYRLGDYGSGLEFTARNQYLIRDGYAYRVANATTLPYVTTGNWALESEKFSLFSQDDILRQDLSNTADPKKGVSIAGRAVVSVGSISSLLLQNRRTDLSYVVMSYYAIGNPAGGGVFFWDAESTDPENYGTIFSVPGVMTGRFKRVIQDTYLHTSDFGIDHSGLASAVDRLQAMIDFGAPIWVDEGALLIDKTVFYRNTKMRGPGVLKIVVDSNFTPIGSGFLQNDAVFIPPGASTSEETYNVDLDINATFSNSIQGKPHTPFRFLRLRDSRIKMDIACSGSGDVLSTNLPDFYFDNRNVKISGRYVVNQRLTSLEGGMWVRDVGVAGADSPTRYSENVVVEADTYIQNDGVDEALAFFNPSGGTLYNCGVLGATLVGGGLGLSILEFGAANRSQTRMDCYAIGTKVRVTSLRTSQAAVKFDKSVARIFGVNVQIAGFRDTTVSGEFYAGFRNSNSRTDSEHPLLVGCKVIMAVVALPASEVRAFDGPLKIIDGEIAKAPGAAAFSYGVRNGFLVQGGRWPGASIYTFDTVVDVLDARPGTVTYNNVTRRRGIGVYKTEILTPNGTGDVTMTHGFGVNPIFAEASLENNATLDIYIVSKNSASVVGRIINRSTGAAITSGAYSVIWKVEA